MATIGELTYVVDAQTKNLNKVIQEVQRLSKSLERTTQALNRTAAANQRAFTQMGKSAQQGAAAQQRAASSNQKALARQNRAVDQARQRLETLRTQIKSSSTGSVDQLGRLQRSFNAMEKRMKSGAMSSTEFTKAQDRFKRVSGNVATELKTSEKAHKANVAQLQRQQQATASARQRTSQLVSQLRQMGASREQVRSLAGSFRNYEKRMKSGAMSTQQFQQTQAQFNKRLGVFRSRLGQLKIQRATRQTSFWRNSVQDLTKSVQVALGPLSGVAARITAMSALFQTNTAIIAALVGVLTGFVVALGAAISAGLKFEQEMRRIEGVIETMGDKAAVTAEEVNVLARELARGTLASANEARRAGALLASFGNIGRSIFQDVLEAAQGLSVLMGGALQLNIRRLGRLLQDPVNQMSALSRAGIQFSESQELMIESLVRGGKLLEAQEFLLGEIRPLIVAAKEEADSLAGAWDSMVEAGRELLEVLANQSGLLETSRDIIQGVADEFDRLRVSTSTMENVGNAFNATAEVLGGTLLGLVRNFDLVIAAFTGFVVGGTASAVIRNLDNIRIGISALISAVSGLGVAAQTTGVRLRLLRRGLTTLLGPLTAAAAILIQFASRTEESAGFLDSLTAGARAAASEIKGLTARLDELNEEEMERLKQTQIEAEAQLRSLGAEFKRQGSTISQMLRRTRIDLEAAKSGEPIDLGAIAGESVREQASALQRQVQQLEQLREVFRGVKDETLSTSEAFDQLRFEGVTEDIDDLRLEMVKVIGASDDLAGKVEALERIFGGFNEEQDRGIKVTNDNLFALADLINEVTSSNLQLKEWARNQDLINGLLNETTTWISQVRVLLADLDVPGRHIDRIVRLVEENKDAFREWLESLLGPGQKAEDQFQDIAKRLQELREETVALRTGPGAVEDLEREREIQEELDNTRVALIEANVEVEKRERLMRRLEDALRANAEAERRFIDVSQSLSQEITQGFADMILEGEKFKDVINNLIDAFAEMALQAALLKPLEDQFTRFFEGLNFNDLFRLGGPSPSPEAGTGAPAAGAPIPRNPAMSQHGNVFKGPSLTTISEGGKPEAVLPLSRTSGGDLGVAAMGNGGGEIHVEVNVINESGEPLEASEQGTRRGPNGEAIVDVMVKSSLRRMKGSGELDSILSDFTRRKGRG